MSDATTGQGEPESTEAQPREVARERWLRRRTRGGAPLWLRTLTALVLLVLAGAFVFLSQTAPGQRIVVNEILRRVRAELAGELRVGDIHSQTLVAGVTLEDVRLDAQGGVPVLTADSVVLRYSLLSLIAGSPRIRSTTLHGLDLEIAPHPDEDVLNLQRILAPGDGSASGTSGGSPLGLGRISVRRGEIVVLTPTDRPGTPAVFAPDGTPLRRLAFEAVDLDLEQTVLRTGGAVSFDARLTSFSATVRVVEEPLVVRAAVGDVTFGREGLRVGTGTFRLQGSLLEGGLRLGPDEPGGPWRFTADVQADDWGDLEDLAWIDPRIPAGEFRGGAEVRTDAGLAMDLRDFHVRTDGSDVIASGGVRFDDDMTLSRMSLSAARLALAEVEPWAGREIPLDGSLSGRATFTGTLDALTADGRLTLAPAGGGSATSMEFAGRLFTGDDPGADSLVVRLDPFDYRLLAAWWPRLEVMGTGSGSLELDGRAADGIAVNADFTHVSEAEPTSRVSARGVLRRDERGEWAVDARGELSPFALGFVSRFRPVEGLQGTVSGPVTVDGALDDLHVTGDLTAGDGRLVVDGSLDLEQLGSAYALDLDAEGVQLTYFSDRAIDPGVVSGHVVLEGSGLTLDSLAGAATLSMRASTVGRIRLGSATARVRSEDGMLTIDTLDVDIAGARVSGSGTLGLVPEADGRATFAFAVDSLLSLRPMFMGDSILVRDGLSPLEEDLLRVRGIEPDTLPTEIEVRMAGSASGRAEVRGDFRDLAVDLAFDARGLAYRANQVDSASVTLAASGLPDFTGNWTGSIRAHGITWQDRSFEGVDFDGVMSRQRGEGTLSITRGGRERYFATGSFAVDSLGGQVSLSDASLQIDDLAWVLENPSRIAWDSTSIRVENMALARTGVDPARVTAHGTLARGGDSNFGLSMEGFHVEDALRVLQREDLDLAGHVDLELDILGPAESPTMTAEFTVGDPRYGTLSLARLAGSLDYRERLSRFQVQGSDGRRNVVSMAGTVPLDLALSDVEERQLDVPMDVRVAADSIDAGIALAYFETLEDVVGTISADLTIGGTTRQPEPSGTIRLANGGWTLSALGVRHVGLQGELDVRPDRVVGMRLDAAGSGRSSVTGTIAFDSLSNPEFDLVVDMSRFQAVSRRDIEGMLSGAFTVTGTYQRPVAEGQLTVDQGTLFVEEFQRARDIVDLRDPTLFADGFAVDTTVFVSQPILAALRNPFLDNLSVDIDLSVPRDLWIRSPTMNVEIGGELIMRYDRREGDFVMVGDLQALRGSYQVLGRTFEVETGTVSFLGQPGVNPSLNIEALSRIRRRQGDRLEVRATVTGTLVTPLVTLSTTESGLSQPDLVSYVLFGVPSGELGGGAQVGGVAEQGVVVILGGAFGNQVGTALAQRIGFDYLSISQGDFVGDQSLQSNLGRSLSTAQFEVGRYIGENAFLVLVVSRPNNQTPSEFENFFRGVRVEYALTDEWFVEGFWEDRFLRGAGNLGQAGLDGEKVLGVLTFVDWGYGTRDREN
ncbi:MAG: translocation/assembly module TamB domain-containing protein [Gemmatimonadales bacterium]